MTMRILFVDDELNVLAGLKRMLRIQRNEWDMHFAGGGAAALNLMREHSFDVVVSDMRMPGMDGAELLTRVSEQYPNTVRLVLSGQSEHEKIFRAVGPAHQFMSKPCDPEELIKTIQRACTLQNRMQDDALRRIVTQVKFLPCLPSVYRNLVEKLKSEDSTLDEIGEIIGNDISMTAKVLQLVNSSFFGLPQHVTCPSHAVSLLGLNVIRPIVLAMGAFSHFDDIDLKDFSLQKVIDHSLGVATIARKIASAKTTVASVVDDAFMAGMLHDIGKLILAANLRESFEAALRISREGEIPLWQAEKQVFGTTHAEIGAHLLGLWNLPNPIVEAVAFHHQPSDASQKEFSPLTAVHVANVLHRIRDDEAKEDCYDQNYLRSVGVSGDVGIWESFLEKELI